MPIRSPKCLCIPSSIGFLNAQNTRLLTSADMTSLPANDSLILMRAACARKMRSGENIRIKNFRFGSPIPSELARWSLCSEKNFTNWLHTFFVNSKNKIQNKNRRVLQSGYFFGITETNNSASRNDTPAEGTYHVSKCSHNVEVAIEVCLIDRRVGDVFTR